MPKLSSAHHDLKSHYPVVVIGSGYGGAIAASRFARAKQNVCLLERGKEFQVGDYPDTELEALCNLQVQGLAGFQGPQNGLYHIYFDQELSAFVGCGLGGTSLVNANVCLRAEPAVFEDPIWPEELVKDLNTLLEDSYQHAEAMLRPLPYPQSYPSLAKLNALEQAANAMHATFYRPPLAVNFSIKGQNHVGVWQQPCQLCGDCVSGCNYAAKNTLIMNYLPDAKNHGAEIFTEILVLAIEQQAQRFIVYYRDLALKDAAAEQVRFLTANIVLLAAGTFGSTEILLRSKAQGLSLSDQVGQHLTGNGDVLAFGYNLIEPTNGIGFGAHAPEGRAPVGPCITGIIDLRDGKNLDEAIVIEEGAIPGGMAAFLPKVLTLSARFCGFPGSSNKPLAQLENEFKSLILGPYYGAVNHTLTFLVMAHDDGKGKLSLQKDQLQIHWPDVGSQAIFDKINNTLGTVTHSLGGTFIPNPIWSEVTGHTLITVHPLGGCAMANDAKQGVVNHKGQVFCSTEGDTVYENLYVVDGSIIPRSIGVNPLLTIAALAERCLALAAKDRSWTINYELPSTPMVAARALTVGLEFTETMRGRISETVLDDYTNAFNDPTSTPFEFTLTIYVADLEAMLSEEAHAAKISGQVTIPTFSKKPMMVNTGSFNLFVDDANKINSRKMLYQMTLDSVEGKSFAFEGFKTITNDSGLDVWQDTTTLYVNLYDISEDRKLCGKGVLKILPEDFIRQLTTMRVLNTTNKAKIMAAQIRFGNFFAGSLFQIYGGSYAQTSYFNPQAEPRPIRQLRVSHPEIYFFNTEDQQQLKLTRYQGGDKGPVLLTHGLGVSSRIFRIDTIETNLLEYLFAQGYDVWLLDYRASIDLPTATTLFTADDIARFDYPSAVNKVLEISKAKDVQIVAHCYGATTLSMAVLAGLQHVRSIVFSQIATHMIVPADAKIKAGLYLPSFLRKLGISSLTAYADTNQNWQQSLFDSSLKLTNLANLEPCQSAVCRRITFLYGQLYEHAQLNSKTHDALHEMFGLANIASFEHLALMVRRGHVVNAKGQETYLANLKRLAIPSAFIHGSENHCFLPESTALTFHLLQEINGKDLYTRHLIPGYGHIDCIFGAQAVHDVYPYILEHLEAYAYRETKVVI